MERTLPRVGEGGGGSHARCCVTTLRSSTRSRRCRAESGVSTDNPRSFTAAADVNLRLRSSRRGKRKEREVAVVQIARVWQGWRVFVCGYADAWESARAQTPELRPQETQHCNASRQGTGETAISGRQPNRVGVERWDGRARAQ